MQCQLILAQVESNISCYQYLPSSPTPKHVLAWSIQVYQPYFLLILCAKIWETLVRIYYLLSITLTSIQYLRLIGQAKCHQQINREIILSLGKQSLVGILIVSDYPPTSAINIFSNDQIYCPCQHLFSAMLCLSLSPSLSLLLSPYNFGFNPVVHCHLDHLINVFHKELFSFQRLHLHESLPTRMSLSYVYHIVSASNWLNMGNFKDVIAVVC